MKRPTRDQARELVDKLERLAGDAEDRTNTSNDLDNELARERAVNYAHAAELARNTLGVR